MPTGRNRSSDVAYRRVAEELVVAILRGDFKAGDRLPTERELSRRFGVSHLVVREALRILKQQGLITVRRGQGGGIFVAHPNSHPVQKILRILLRTRRVSMEHVTEVRMIYEPKIAHLAAERITEEELGRLAQVIEQQEEALRRGEHEAFDLQFHRIVAEATRNPVLLLVMEAIVNVLLPEVRRMHLDPDSKSHILDFHRKLYAALAARDPERAGDVMAEHVAGIQKQLAQLHKERFPEAGGQLMGADRGA